MHHIFRSQFISIFFLIYLFIVVHNTSVEIDFVACYGILQILGRSSIDFPGRSDKERPPDLEFNGMGMIRNHATVTYGLPPRIPPTNAID